MRWLGRIFVVISVVLVSSLIFACEAAPVRWYMKPDSAWRVRVVDKTVPHVNYREHAALFWVLRHEKAATPQGRRDWDLHEDYVGFYPVSDPKDGPGRGRELIEDDLSGDVPRMSWKLDERSLLGNG